MVRKFVTVLSNLLELSLSMSSRNLGRVALRACSPYRWWDDFRGFREVSENGRLCLLRRRSGLSILCSTYLCMLFLYLYVVAPRQDQDEGSLK